ncbi:MAG: right-handed parallel beta-helix repeat-containing protein [Candidatus Dormibacteraeota bacterium]|nr:right-handed parallel beta-helix repeat-containing protein [Candidatus Dormibacteraeota bacterium]
MRLRLDNQSGFLAATLATASSAIEFATPPGFATITSPDYYAIELEPGTPRYEVVYLTAFTAGAGSGTVLRAREGTAAVPHLSGVAWSHSPTAYDFLGTEYFPVKQFAAKGDGVVLYDATMTANSNILSSPSASFTATDVGKAIGVVGAGPNASWGGLANGTTISAWVNAQTIQLSNTASVSVSNAVCVYGTDDTKSFQAALNSAKAAGGGRVSVAAGTYVISKMLQVDTNCALVGLSRNATRLFLVGNFDSGVIRMGTPNAPYETDMEVRSLTVGMVGPNQRNGSAFGVGAIASRFTIDDVEVSLPAKTGTLAGLAAGATTASFTLVSGGPPADGEVLLIDIGGFSEVRAITSVRGTGPYTVGWSGGILSSHNASAVAQALNYSSPCIGILAPPSAAATEQIGPGLIHNCLVCNTIADAIYTANSDSLTVLACEVTVSGDDAISCHSASAGGPQQTDTSIIGCTIEHAGARGISVLGGLRTIVEGNTVAGAFGAGINLAAGQGFQALDTCIVEGNTLRDCGSDLQPSYAVGSGGAPRPTVTVSGVAAYFGGSNNTFTHVKVVDNEVRNFKGGGILFYSSDGTAALDSVEVINNSIESWNSAALTTGQYAPPSYAGIYVEKTLQPTTELEVSGNTIRSPAGEGISIASSVEALVEVADNLLASVNASGLSSISAISCLNTGVSVVTGNELGGSVASVTNFADLNGAGSGSAIWGNADAGLPTVNFIGGAMSGTPVGNGHTRWYGAGAPAGALGIDGDYYEREDGGSGTHLYFRSSGTWSAIV